MRKLKMSNHAKTDGTIRMISRCLITKCKTNIVLKFGDNRLKGRGATGGSIWADFRKSVITQKRKSQ